MTKKVRVLIVDDSEMVRQLLTSILRSDPDIEVVGTAEDPYVAREKIKSLNPDVITLDVEMPRMDGISFLEKIMRLRPMPVIMVSTLTQKGADITVQALEMGALDFVAKPTMDLERNLSEKAEELIQKVKMAASARLSSFGSHKPQAQAPIAKMNGTAAVNRIIAIGASTGGVEALKDVLASMPADSPPILITQHMPGHFTASFARRLDSLSQLTVSEAVDGQTLEVGHAYIAPGDHHMELVKQGGRYVAKLNDGPLCSGHRPSVDVLFHSVAKTAGADAIGVILTGMGRDGAKGMKEMLEAGAYTIGQDESTCVVYGMPRSAREIGAVKIELPLSKIAAEIVKNCK